MNHTLEEVKGLYKMTKLTSMKVEDGEDMCSYGSLMWCRSERVYQLATRGEQMERRGRRKEECTREGKH